MAVCGLVIVLTLSRMAGLFSSSRHLRPNFCSSYFTRTPLRASIVLVGVQCETGLASSAGEIPRDGSMSGDGVLRSECGDIVILIGGIDSRGVGLE